MAPLDISRLSAQERLDLIEQLRDSLDADDVPLSPTQSAELNRRLATLDDDIKEGRDARAVLNDLRQRHR